MLRLFGLIGVSYPLTLQTIQPSIACNLQA